MTPHGWRPIKVKVKNQDQSNGQECPLHTSRLQGRLNADVQGAEGVFVGFPAFGEFGVGVVFEEVGGIPFFPGDHGMVGSGQGFFGANGGDPFVGGLLVGLAELVEIGWAHGLEGNSASYRGQSDGAKFTEN